MLWEIFSRAGHSMGHEDGTEVDEVIHLLPLVMQGLRRGVFRIKGFQRK